MKKPTQALKQILNENTNHSKIKQTLKFMCETRQKANYHAHVSSSETYLQVRGLINHNYDQFNYIHRLLHSRVVSVIGKIKRQDVIVRNRIQQARQQKLQRQKQQNYVNQQIAAQVQQVINNVDLPISLFKRDDKYWYPQNPKTIQAKQYVHERIKRDKQRKKQVRQKQKQISKKKQQQQKQQMQKFRKMQEEKKQQLQMHLQNKLEQIRRSKEERTKIINQSQKFGSALNPLYKKIQQQQYKQRKSALEDHKRRLSQLRKMHQSVDLVQLQERKNKLDQIQKNKEKVKIFNEPVKVYKSKYYTSMTSRSRVSQYENNKSLYEKKKQYGDIVRKQFKPDVNPDLVAQMEERLKIMKRRRVRKNPKPKKRKNSQDQDEDSEQDQAQSKVKAQAPKHDPLDEDYDSDDQDDKPPRRVLGQDQDPNHAQRYQIGVQYLQYVRNLPKKYPQKTNTKFPEQIEQQQRKSRYQKGNTGHKQFYKDYLQQFTRANRNTIDHIDVSRIQRKTGQLSASKDYETKTRFANQARFIEQKAKNQQQLLKFKKVKNETAMEKKAQIDNAMIETIKARLAMMG